MDDANVRIPCLVGSAVSFNATASDVRNDTWKLIVCKTDAVTAGVTPSCPGGEWCLDDTVRASGATRLVFACPFSAADSPTVPAQKLRRLNDRNFELVSRESDCWCWCALHPLLDDSWKQARQMIAEDRCVGIKTMVSAQGWAIDSHAGRDLFAFLEETGVAGLFHSYSEWEDPRDFVTLAKEFPAARFIVAHAGAFWPFTQHVEAAREAQDTGMHIGIDQPQYAMFWGLLEHSLQRLPSSRMVYGSDAPCHVPWPLIERIKRSTLDDEDKRNILGASARRLFGWDK